ncbi:MAG: MFS transporter, partial [Acidimicrobiales bacterium]|nr:MFS transporter [Acidimicrobiales bacterium]
MTPPPWTDRSAGWRWGFGVLLFLSMAVGAFLNSALSVLAPFLRDDVGLSRAQLGGLATVISLVAALGSPLAGTVVDSLGPRRMLVVGGGGVLASLVLLASVSSFPWMLAAVTLTGAALAVGNPATNKLIAQHVPAGHQGLLMGIKQSGGQLNWVLAGSILPSVAVAAGWRWSLGIGMALAATNIVVVRAVLPREAPVRRQRPGADGSAPLGSLIAWMSAYAFLMASGTVAVNLYLPLFAHESVGISERQAGLVAAGMAVVSIATRIVWSHRLERVSAPGIALAVMAALSV